jgi:hypothetical protein
VDAALRAAEETAGGVKNRRVDAALRDAEEKAASK